MTHAWILARLQGRELLRRRLAPALLVGMPVAFYLTSVGAGSADAGADLWAAVSGAIGIGFAVCGAAFFTTLAGRRVRVGSAGGQRHEQHYGTDTHPASRRSPARPVRLAAR